jgi:hypothetical protein
MGSASARLHFIIFFLANNANGLKVHGRPPLLHVLIPLHPHLVVYTFVGTVTVPELNGEKKRGEERRDVE